MKDLTNEEVKKLREEMELELPMRELEKLYQPGKPAKRYHQYDGCITKVDNPEEDRFM